MGDRRKALFAGIGMGKKTNAIYEPGELRRVREKLGDIDVDEAKRMARVLGGEVGTEKAEEPAKRDDSDRARGRPGRAIDVMIDEEDELFSSGSKKRKQKKNDPADNPLIALQTSYFERVKMDRFAAMAEFEIKNSMQVLGAIFPFVNRGDYINPRFTSRRMNSYYNKIGQLVSSTRILLPRSDARRSERLKKTSPYIYSILDTIRQWNIERIGEDLARLQSHPRSVKVADYAELLRAIYKPIFILERLDADIHVKGSFKVLCKLLYRAPDGPKGQGAAARAQRAYGLRRNLPRRSVRPVPALDEVYFG